jgi:hypothetical protein
VTGRGQWPVAAVCDGAGIAGPWVWCRVRAGGLLGPGTRALRSVLVGAAWLLDVVTVEVPAATSVDLPFHPLVGAPAGGAPASAGGGLSGDAGHESGYGSLADVRVVPLPYALALGPTGGASIRLLPRAGEKVLTAIAPGPPGWDFGAGGPLRFLIRRAAGPGRWVQLLSWADPPPAIADAEGVIEITQAGVRTSVRETTEGVTIVRAGEPPRTFTARTMEPVPAPSPPPPRVAPDCTIPLWSDDAEPFAAGLPTAVWLLGEGQYRRSELPHADRGGTRAEVAVAAQGDAVWVRVRVVKPDVVVRSPLAPDPALDNEVADIHSDGVQAYVGRDRWMGVIALPSFASGAVRHAGVAGTASFPGPVTGTSRRTDAGYEMWLRLPTGHPWRRGDRVRFTVTVNEMVPGRERRSGQLAMAGGGWVWLRGDRESPDEAVEAEIA